MALVVLGSRRITRGFDFVVPTPAGYRRQVVDVLFDHGLEWASRLNDTGDVAATIRNRRVADSRSRRRAFGRVLLQSRHTAAR
jgi:hypothetical protein